MTGEEGYTVVGSEHYTTYEGHAGLASSLFFFLGCMVGAGAALLLTPQSGSKTRQQLQEASKETRDKAGSRCGRGLGIMGAALDRGKELMREQKPLLSAAVEAGRAAYEREKADKKARMG